MLPTITNAKAPATDLGYLIHKKPSRVQSFELSFPRAHVFHPEATSARCTAALLLDMDPGGRCGLDPALRGSLLERHVNDRPYVARSLMSVAITRVFASRLGIPTGVGRSLSFNHCPLRRESPCCPAEVTGSYAGCSSRSATITAEHHPLDDENFPNRRSVALHGRDLTVGFSLQKAIEVVGRSREKVSQRLRQTLSEKRRRPFAGRSGHE